MVSIVRSTYCIFVTAEKKHVANVTENINANVIMLSQFSVILAADISSICCQRQSSSVVHWLPESRDSTACTHLNLRVNCCVKSFLHPLVNLPYVTAHARNRLAVFRPHLHFGQSIQESHFTGNQRFTSNLSLFGRHRA